MSVRLLRSDLYVVDLPLRIPFRFGVATLTRIPHLFFRGEFMIGGSQQLGVAAENLSPKWFKKDPTTSIRDDLGEMLAVIRHAARVAGEIGTRATPFELWLDVYRQQMRWAKASGHHALLAGFGASLVERSVIDAFCRAEQTTFATALRTNELGVDLGSMVDALRGREPSDFLPSQPAGYVKACHTIGLLDPLRGADITEGERCHDGLPQALDECVSAYGLQYFKAKLSGMAADDVHRLRAVAEALDASVSGEWKIALDGNEQFADVAHLEAYWGAMSDAPQLTGLVERVWFLEQPLPQDIALRPEAVAALKTWTTGPNLTIDESDAELGSVPVAIEIGYKGTAYKSCKGVFRGVANACSIEHERRTSGQEYILTGGDLSAVGPVSLLQDLAVAASLGLHEVERNGHHYVHGLSSFPQDVQGSVVAHHGDLYGLDSQGCATLRIDGGKISLTSALEAPFGVAPEFDPVDFADAVPDDSSGWSRP